MEEPTVGSAIPGPRVRTTTRMELTVDSPFRPLDIDISRSYTITNRIEIPESFLIGARIYRTVGTVLW